MWSSNDWPTADDAHIDHRCMQNLSGPANLSTDSWVDDAIHAGTPWTLESNQSICLQSNNQGTELN